MNTIAVVALSARVMAEAAARDGFQVLAVDLFGDQDTRRACQQWWPAGLAGSLPLDPVCVLQALRQIAQRGDVLGWVAGSGCEGQPALMLEAAAVLPLLGTSPQALQRVRDPLAFFSFLGACGIVHPEVRSTAPEDAENWLVKNANGCGGGHIQPANTVLQGGASGLQAQHYFQRRAVGVPMSATFCAASSGVDAARSTAVVLGFNQLIVRPQGAHPFVYCGVVGPVPLATTPARAVLRAVRLVCAEMNLQGLCSLDFLLDGDTVQVLEVNPRAPASMALYGSRVAGGVMAAHVNACRKLQLPTLWPASPAADSVQGTEIVFAAHDLQIRPALAQTLHTHPACHDLPMAGTRLRPGDPLCSVSACGANAEEVLMRLNIARSALLNELKGCA